MSSVPTAYSESRLRGSLFSTVVQMCGTEQPREQPQIVGRGSNSVVVIGFSFIFSYWVHIFSLSFFIC